MAMIKKPSELSVKATLSVLIYGQPGIGKTTLGVSAPDAVLFDYDGGVQRINGAHQVPTLQPTSWEDTNLALKEIQEEMPEVKTIVIDTVGKMLDFMSAYIIKNDPKMAMRDGSLSLKGYGVRKTMFVNFIKQLAVMGKNVVFIAHEREERRGEETFKRPEIGGSSANDLIKELDLVGYMYAIGKERVITFDPAEYYYAKNTCNLPAAIKLPVVVKEDGTALGNVAFTNIVKSYKDAQAKKQETTGRYEMLLDLITSTVEEATDCASLNEAMKTVFGYEHIYDSLLRAQKAVAKKGNELKLVYNKSKKQYEPAEI
jgi:phage nucleotide-binding protein